MTSICIETRRLCRGPPSQLLMIYGGLSTWFLIPSPGILIFSFPPSRKLLVNPMSSCSPVHFIVYYFYIIYLKVHVHIVRFPLQARPLLYITYRPFSYIPCGFYGHTSFLSRIFLLQQSSMFTTLLFKIYIVLHAPTQIFFLPTSPTVILAFALHYISCVLF